MSNTTVITAERDCVMIKPSVLNWLRVRCGTDVPTRPRRIRARAIIDHQGGACPILVIHNPRPGYVVLRVRNDAAPGTWRIVSPPAWEDLTPRLTLADTVRSWFSWRVVAQEGQWEYHENTVTKARRVVKLEVFIQHAIMRRTWLAGGDW